MSHLSAVTPIIITYNEAANIQRCLDHLTWAEEIIVVDSGSTDATRAICEAQSNVRVFERPFDSHAGQWTYAVFETGVKTPWVLALDCDYIVTEDLVREIASLPEDDINNAYVVGFRYAQFGHVLNSGVYPPLKGLFKPGHAHYIQDGHAMRAIVDGPSGALKARMIHDDRKPLDHWLKSQQRYSMLEALKLMSGAHGLTGFIRTRTPFAPIVVGIYCLFVRGGIFEGPAGWLYALQRMLAEAMIGCTVWDLKMRAEIETSPFQNLASPGLVAPPASSPQA